MVDIKRTRKHKDFFDVLKCPLDNRGFVPIADHPSHLRPEMSDFLFVPGDDPDGSSLADQPFDELSTNISGSAGNKNHWCSPYTLVLPNPKAGVSEGDPNHFPELSAIRRRFSFNSIHLET